MYSSVMPQKSIHSPTADTREIRIWTNSQKVATETLRKISASPQRWKYSTPKIADAPYYDDGNITDDASCSVQSQTLTEIEPKQLVHGSTLQLISDYSFTPLAISPQTLYEYSSAISIFVEDYDPENPSKYFLVLAILVILRLLLTGVEIRTKNVDSRTEDVSRMVLACLFLVVEFFVLFILAVDACAGHRLKDAPAKTARGCLYSLQNKLAIMARWIKSNVGQNVGILSLLLFISTALVSEFTWSRLAETHYLGSARILLMSLEMLLIIDYCHFFQDIKEALTTPSCLCFRREKDETPLLPISLLILAVLLGVTISITYPLSNEDKEGEVLTSKAIDEFEIIGIFIVFLLLAMVCISFWDFFSFQIRTRDAVVAILHVTLVGSIALEAARFIRKPGKTSWHKYHNKQLVVDYMILIVFIIFIAIVVIGNVLVAAFAELGTVLNGIDFWLVSVIYMIVAYLGIINVFFSASVIDAVGGFVLIQCRGSISFVEASVIICALVVFLHFSGSCLQWFIGRLKPIQRWLNYNTPVLLLTASDSVYKDAGIIKAGLLGGAFPDTINGYNQGRMGMSFCVQFWSEWSAIPNGLAFTIGGILLGYGEAAAYTSIPILLSITVIMNSVQFSYSFSLFGRVMNDVQFWTAFEKWSTVRYFQEMGYCITQYGWDKDCFEIEKLVGKLRPYYIHKAAILEPVSKDENAMEFLRLYEVLMHNARQEHYDSILKILQFSSEKSFHKKKGVILDLNKKKVEAKWYWTGLLKTQIFILIVLYVTGIGSYYCLKVDTFDVVEGGFSELSSSENSTPGFIAMTIHLLFAAIYWKQTIVRFFQGMFHWCRPRYNSPWTLDNLEETEFQMPFEFNFSELSTVEIQEEIDEIRDKLELMEISGGVVASPSAI